MSIGKFTKKSLVSAPDVELFKAMPSEYRTNGIEVIKKVLKRVHKLGVNEFEMLADSSLNLEAFKYINESLEGSKTSTYESIPESFKSFWLENFSNNDRLDLIFFPSQSIYNESLLNIENDISNILKGKDISKAVGDSDKRAKFDFTRDVFILTAMGHRVNKENIALAKNIYEEALAIMGVHKRDFEYSIKEYLEDNYKIATDMFLQESMNRMKDVEKTENEVEEQAKSSILSVINKARKKQSSDDVSFNFGFDKDLLRGDLQLEEEEEEVKDSISSAFSDEEKKNEAYATGKHLIEFTKIQNLCNDYAVTILKTLCESNLLLLNFYVSTTDKKYKALSEYGGNRFCLNVDLKTGEVELLLKGQNFKLNPFFEEGEKVVVNANEW